MENLNKQGGEKQRKTGAKIDSSAHQAPEKKKEEMHEREEIKADIRDNVKVEEKKDTTGEAKTESKPEEKKEEKTTEAKDNVRAEAKKAEQKPRVKKEMAFIKMSGLPISTKHSIALCRFIKGRPIGTALDELGRVARGKLAVPMRGEIPHRHGRGMMSGRYPINASKVFIKVLKSLEGNSSVNGIENPVITLASASWGSRPQKRGGMKFKRTHLYIEARERVNKKESKTKEEKSKENKPEEKK